MIRYISLLLFIGFAWGQSTTIAVLDFDGDGVSQSETRTLESEYTDSTTTQYEARTKKKVESTDKANNIIFEINLATGATPSLSGYLWYWYSTTNSFRASVEVPLLMQVLLVGVEVGTFGFEHGAPPATDTYKGVIVMGITSLSAGPLKIKVGAGKVGSSTAFIKEGTLGFRIGRILDIWGGFRSTDVKAASSTESLELGDLSWEELCVGITYNWMQ